MDNIIEDMQMLAPVNRQPVATESVQRAATACADLPQGLLKSYREHVAEHRHCRKTASCLDQDDFQQTIRKVGQDDKQIWRAQRRLDQDIMMCMHRWLRKKP